MEQPGLQQAYELSILSLIASAVAVMMGAVSSIQTRSATALGYSLENSVDFLGSVLVLWRFSGGGSQTPKQVLESREQRADVGISFMFIILGCVVAADGAKELVDHQGDKDLIELIALYSPSVVVFLLLGTAKIHVGRCVKSHSLQKDGMCSLAGALLSSGVLVSALIEEFFSSIWWVDSFLAVIVAIGLATQGFFSIRAFALRGVAWWTLDFWEGHHGKTPVVTMLPLDDEPLLGGGGGASSKL